MVIVFNLDFVTRMQFWTYQKINSVINYCNKTLYKDNQIVIRSALLFLLHKYNLNQLLNIKEV